MIRWCSYCSIYLGETAPYDDYSLTHGICPRCRQAHYLEEGTPIPERTLKLMAFYAKLQKKIYQNEIFSSEEIITEFTNLGIRPIDLLFGIIQPALYEVGQKWEQLKLTIAQEHCFTSSCLEVIDRIWSLFPEEKKFRHSSAPRVLLVTANRNQHDIGIRLLEILLSIEKIPNFIVYPGLPPHEIFELSQKLKPDFLAISISLFNQMSSLDELYEYYKKIPTNQHPQFLVGGRPFREGWIFDHPSPFKICTEAQAFLLQVKQNGSA